MASVETCRALVALSTDDVANLETALLARAVHTPRDGKLRVLLRLFDEEFAERVKSAFDLELSRSVSYLAAPAFAAAMMGREVIATIPVGRRVLLIAELPVGAGSDLDGKPCSDVSQCGEIRLIAVRGRYGQTLWRWPPRRELVRTERIVVVTTRAGLVRLLERTAEVDNAPPLPEAPPLRLLELRDQRRAH